MRRKKNSTSQLTSEAICERINKELQLDSKHKIFPFTIISWKKAGFFIPTSKKVGKFTEKDVKKLEKLALYNRRLGLRLSDLVVIEEFFKINLWD